MSVLVGLKATVAPPSSKGRTIIAVLIQRILGEEPLHYCFCCPLFDWIDFTILIMGCQAEKEIG